MHRQFGAAMNDFSACDTAVKPIRNGEDGAQIVFELVNILTSITE